MSKKSEIQGEMLCAWSGPIAMIVFIFSIVVCYQWVMPPPPSLSASEITEVYRNNLAGIRIGVVLMVLAGAATVPYFAIMMVQMLRMKGPTPALAYTQFALGALQVMLFIIPAIIFSAAAYRLDRPVEITQFGNDLGWLLFDMVVSMTIVQWVAIGIAVLQDKSADPVYPRWFGFFNLWCSVLVLPNNLIVFFKTGPFAWNGLLGWYPGASTFCIWYFVAFVVVRKAVLAARRAAD